MRLELKTGSWALTKIGEVEKHNEGVDSFLWARKIGHLFENCHEGIDWNSYHDLENVRLSLLEQKENQKYLVADEIHGLRERSVTPRRMVTACEQSKL